MHRIRACSLAALAAAALSAPSVTRAASFEVTFEPGATVAYFTSPTGVLSGGADVITFKGLASGSYLFQLQFGGWSLALDSLRLEGADWSLTLAGVTAGPAQQGSVFTFASGSVTGAIGDDPVLTLTGGAYASGTPFYTGALYATRLVSPVPEPEGALLALCGAGVLAFGWLRRRRDSDAARPA